MSESSNQFQDFYNYFCYLKDAYPYGVPVESIVTDLCVGSEIVEAVEIDKNFTKTSTEEFLLQASFDYQFCDVPSEIVFVICMDQFKPALQPEKVSFLQKIITDGLKRDLQEDCAVLLVGPSSTNSNRTSY